MFSPDGLIRRKIKDYAPNFWLGTLGRGDGRADCRLSGRQLAPVSQSSAPQPSGCRVRPLNLLMRR
jgi:hypothetical protein